MIVVMPINASPAIHHFTQIGKMLKTMLHVTTVTIIQMAKIFTGLRMPR